MGTKPEIPIENESTTFAEKKGLLAEMIKLAELERKGAEEQEEITGLDLIRKQINGSGTGTSRGAFERAESGFDDEAGTSGDEA